MNAFFGTDNSMASTIFIAVFWFATASLFYVYAGYPLLLALFGLVASKKRRPGDSLPTVSVLISAYNEEASIERKVRATLSLDYPEDKLEVVVVSDGSTDKTDTIVLSLREPRVRLLRIEGRRGKTNAQNHAVKICRGEVIVFSDATAVYQQESIRRLAAHYSDSKVAAVSGRYRYFEPECESPSGLGSIAFWDYENLIKWLQNRLGTLTGCSGCIYSVRRASYVPLPDEACSDLVEPLNLVRNGYRVAFEPRALAYEETTVNTGQEWRMRVRVATRGMRGVLSVPELLNPFRRPWPAFQLFSHKILRWLAPVFLAMLFIASAGLMSTPAYLLLFLAQAVFYGFALVSLAFPIHKAWKPLAIPQYFCTLNAAFLAGLLEVARGRKYTTWQTVRNTPQLP